MKLEFIANAVKFVIPAAAWFQLALDGKVLNVQVIPSVEEAAAVALLATTTKVLFP